MDLLDTITSSMDSSRGGAPAEKKPRIEDRPGPSRDRGWDRGQPPPPRGQPQRQPPPQHHTPQQPPPFSSLGRIPKKTPSVPSTPMEGMQIKDEYDNSPRNDQRGGGNYGNGGYSPQRRNDRGGYQGGQPRYDQREQGGSHQDRGNNRGGDRGGPQQDRGYDRGGPDRNRGGQPPQRGGYGEQRDNRGGYNDWNYGDRNQQGGSSYRNDNRGGNRDGPRDNYNRGGGYNGGGGGYRGNDTKQEYKPMGGNYGGGGGGFGARGNQDIEVEMNALRLHTDREMVQCFHIDLIKIARDKQKDITRAPKHDQAYIAKEHALFGIMKTLYEKHPDLFGRDKYCHAYDGGYILYSIGCTIDKLPDKKVEFTYTLDEFRAFFPQHVCSYVAKFEQFKIAIQYTRDVYISGRQFFAGDNQREAIKFFEVVTDCYLHEGNYFHYTNKSFEKNAREVNIGGAKIVKKGLDKNVRLMGDGINSASLVLQSSSKASAFHKNMKLFDYLAEVFRTRADDVPSMLAHQKRDVQKATNELKGVFVSCNHIDRKFVLRKISSENTARSTTFQNKEGLTVSVYDYYRATYNIVIRYPDCPLAVETKPGGTSFYPLELLTVMEGQRVGTAQLGNLAEKVHQEARALPHDQKYNTLQQLERARLRHADNPYLRAFGISLESEFIKEMARVIAPPMRVDGTGKAQIANSRTNVEHFFLPSKTNKPIVVCILDRAISEDTAGNFYRTLGSLARRKGCVVPERAEVTFQNSEGELHQFFQSCARRDVGLVFFITRDKMDKIHNTIKLMETEHNVLTFHLCTDTVNKMTGSGGAATTGNVLRKFNAKLGGINENVAPSTSAIPKGINAKEQEEKMFHQRMFMGLEMSHPAAQCLFDRQQGTELGQPTVVGFSFSLSNPGLLNGFSWYQQSRLHNIKNLTERFKEAVEKNFSANNRLPNELIVYRGGGSEGEFTEIKKEVDQMREGCRKCSHLLGGGKEYRPNITYIVVMAHSNHVIMPSKMPQGGGGGQGRGRVKARDVNVPSGTCIDHGLTDPNYDEFILVPQEANIGTSHAMRAVILVNDGQIPKKELTQVSFYLCFAHQASTQSTGRPNVLYAANELAKRGQNNWKELMDRNGGGSMMSGSSGVRYDKQPGEEVDAYFERKSAEAKCKLPNTYWA